ncbi:MAG: biotin/lipoyl-binding protein, partial [Myxococcota bacterium]
MSSETTTSEFPAAGVEEPIPRQRPLKRALPDESGQEYVLYLPKSLTPESPIVVAVHDSSRDAAGQVEAFVESAERWGAVLVAPRFDADAYPNYNRLGRCRLPKLQNRFANDALHAIVEDVALLIGAREPRIRLFGCEAGGRFALRYALAHPERVSGVVTALAGSYTFPDPGRRFPLGIAEGKRNPGLRFDADLFLRVPMTIIEVPVDSSADERAPLRRVGHSVISESARNGQNFVTAMAAAAAERRLPSLATICEVDTRSRTFESLLEHEAIPDFVFRSLFDPADASQDLAPGDATHAASSGSDSAADSEARAARQKRIRRVLLVTVGLVALFALLAPVLLWLQYRATHVISRDAVVRGHIADVGTRLDGVIKSVEVDTGDRVVAGQIIARLEDRHLEARVRQAHSQLEKAERGLEVERLAIANERMRLRSSIREVAASWSSANAELQAADSLAQEALRRLELQRSLADRGLLAQEQVRVADTEHRTASAQVASARADLQAADAAKELAGVEYDGLEVREKRISVLESEIAAFKAELAVAEADLEGSVIRAPDRGAVVRRIVEPGSATVTGQPVLSIWIGEEVWVEAWIDENE